MRFARSRARLVQELRDKGITDEAVLAAIGRVPRHEFVETALLQRAYEDVALPIGLNQTISQPYTVAYQTALLDVRRGDRVLEVGTGSGYQAAILVELGVQLFSIERHAYLLDRADALLKRLGYRVGTRAGDGTQGWQSMAPFDAILVTAAGSEVPPLLLDQLRIPADDRRPGRLVIPVGDADGQTMLRVTRTGPTSWETETFDRFRFVPLVPTRGPA